MQGRIYINSLAPEKCSLDFSASPSELIDTDTCYGFAYMMTLKHLGIEAHQEERAGLPRLIVKGSTEIIRANSAKLHKHIGLIARYGATRSRGPMPASDRSCIGRILGTLTQDTLVDLPDYTPLIETMAIITDPFADTTNYDGVAVSWGYEAPWTREKVQEGLGAEASMRGIKTFAQQLKLWFDDEITPEVRAQTEEGLGRLRSLFPEHDWDGEDT